MATHFNAAYRDGDFRESFPGTLRGYRIFRIPFDRIIIANDTRFLLSPVQNYAWRSGVNSALCPTLTIKRIVGGRACDLCHEEVRGRQINGTAFTIRGEQTEEACSGTRTISIYHGCEHIPPPGDWRRPAYMKLGSASAPRFDVMTAITPLNVEAEPTHGSATIPEKGCACGFYATYHRDILKNAPGLRNPVNEGAERYFVGVVEASGKVIPGTAGFKAQNMEVVALSPVFPARQFGAETFINLTHQFPDTKLFTLNAEMTEEFPPNDMSSLLSEKAYTQYEDHLAMAQNAQPPQQIM